MLSRAYYKSHSEVMPGMLPAHFHTILFESQAGSADTLSSHPEAMPGKTLCTLPNSFPRVKPAAPVHSHPIWKSSREIPCTLPPNSFRELCRDIPVHTLSLSQFLFGS